jgi:hypothetical protein
MTTKPLEESVQRPQHKARTAQMYDIPVAQGKS